jgi:hypothetical protein
MTVNSKLSLHIAQISILIEMLAFTVSYLRFLPNHTRLVISFSAIALAYLFALVLIPIGMSNRSKYHDRASVWTIVLSILILASPLFGWLYLVVGLRGLN